MKSIVRRSLLLVSVLSLSSCMSRAQVESVDPADTNLAAAIDKVMIERAADGFAGTILVTRDEQAIFLKAYGLADKEKGKPMTVDMIFGMGSAAKQFTGAAILLLEQQGKLKTSDPLSKFFPQAPADKADITIEQIANHAAGFPEYVLGDKGDFDQVSREEALQAILNGELDFKPGARRRYSNAGYTLLALIVEIASGKDFRAFVRDNFFHPLGMTHTGWYKEPALGKLPQPVGYYNGQSRGTYSDWPPSSWVLIGNGGVVSTVADVGRWQREIQYPKLLPQALVDKLCKPIELSTLSSSSDDEEGLVGYGCDTEPLRNGWRLIGHSGVGTATANGGFMQRLVGPGGDYTIAVLSSRLELPEPPPGQQVDKSKIRIHARRAGIAVTRMLIDFHAAEDGAVSESPESTLAVADGDSVSPRVPDSPSGRQFAAWLEAFNSGDRQILQQYAMNNMSPVMQERLPADRLADFSGRTGGFEVRQIKESTPERLIGLVKERNSERIAEFVFEVEAAEPHRVSHLEILLVER